MLKKAKAEARSGRTQGAADKGISKAVLESSHQIWLAGLGAFSKAQQGGKQVFDMLVKQGEILESKTRSAASQTADAAREAAKAKAREMQAKAGGTWDKLEQVFEDRVSRALTRLGVYTSSDVEKLSARVTELSEAVNALLKSQGHRKPSASPSHPVAKRASRSAKAKRGGTSTAEKISPASGAVPSKKTRSATKRSTPASRSATKGSKPASS